MPVTSDEIPHIAFEISVLSRMEAVSGVEDIEIGKHGLMISARGARGLLLPQVALTYGWTAERFLAETCRKAGLGPNAWRTGATIFRFGALVFGEKKLQSIPAS
jgi:uncharacterized protein (TIGR00296 family)